MKVSRVTSNRSLIEHGSRDAPPAVTDSIEAVPNEGGPAPIWAGVAVTAHGDLDLRRAWSLLTDCVALCPANATDAPDIRILMIHLDAVPGGDGEERTYGLENDGWRPVEQISIECAAVVCDAVKASSKNRGTTPCVGGDLLPRSATLRAAALAEAKEEARLAGARVAAFLRERGEHDLAREAECAWERPN